MKSSNLLLKAFSDIKERQLKIKEEQDALLEQNKNQYQNMNDISGEQLAKKVQMDLSMDLKYFKEFQTSLSKYHSKQNIPFSVKTNKMEAILSETNVLFSDSDDETNILRIVNGNMPINISNEINLDELPHLVNSPEDLKLNQFWGTSKVTYLSSAILTTYFTLHSKNINDLSLESPITHVSLLPNDIYLDYNCRFSYIDKEMKGFGYIHSGFSFGGHRFEEKLFPHRKKFGPEDCSSWISKITEFPYEFDTSDLVCTFRSQSSGFVPEYWNESELAKSMQSFYYPIKTENLTSGDIFIYRDFDLNNGDPKDNIGVSGHTGIILDKISHTTVRTLCFTRDMPYMEGFGTKDYSLLPSMVSENKKRIPMVLRLKP